MVQAVVGEGRKSLRLDKPQKKARDNFVNLTQKRNGDSEEAKRTEAQMH